MPVRLCLSRTSRDLGDMSASCLNQWLSLVRGMDKSWKNTLKTCSHHHFLFFEKRFCSTDSVLLLLKIVLSWSSPSWQSQSLYFSTGIPRQAVWESRVESLGFMHYYSHCPLKSRVVWFLHHSRHLNMGVRAFCCFFPSSVKAFPRFALKFLFRQFSRVFLSSCSLISFSKKTFLNKKELVMCVCLVLSSSQKRSLSCF